MAAASRPTGRSGWDWKVDEERRAHASASIQWNGRHYAQVLDNDVPAPPAK